MTDTAINALEVFKTDMNAAFDARIVNERKNESVEARIVDNKVNKIETYRKTANNVNVLATLLASNVDANFINAKDASNIYTVKKIVDTATLVAAQIDVHTFNIFVSAVRLSRADMSMTADDAKAIICDKLKIDAKKAKHVQRSVKFYDASTAAAQSSSSLAMLRTLNVLKQIRCSETNKVAHVVDFDAHATHALLKTFEKSFATA